LTRRQDAAQRIFSEDYSGAEELLRELLQERFEVPSTHCHLARVLLMTDRVEEAQREINQAWVTREEAPPYFVPRILFFQCAFALLDAANTNTVVGQIKAALCARLVPTRSGLSNQCSIICARDWAKRATSF